MRKIVVGGLLGGIVLFVWSFLAHLPPIGTAGERALPPAHGEALLGAMHERAVYILYRGAGEPSAVIAYNPHPGGFAKFMLFELLFNLIAALLGAVIAANLPLRFWPRVFVIATIGVLEVFDIDGGYWNWYGYPTSYFLAQFVDHVGGWFFAGMLLARYFRRG